MIHFLSVPVVGVQVEVFSVLLVSALIMMALLYVNAQIKKADPYKKPSGVVLLATIYVEFIWNLTKDNMGKKAAKQYAPYVGMLAMFMLISNLSGLFGLSQPTANYSVTLTLALITFFLIQYTVYRTNGLKQFFHRFFEPHPLFFIMNVFGVIAPLISLSLRLFGNITSGTIMMGLLYSFTGFISELIIPFIGKFDFLGVVIAPIFHAYFDVFAGLIQTYIFIMLTTILIGVELPKEE
ncbi:MAG: hypothetical protein A2Y20_08085 [Firmicutes bacterium GWF2_51_9]|nr:F0F1 ATP synthase subunit A [Erysipelotrichaceae bacterium]OGS54660.1 MAG: hypothetical protein A2Y20_08085 [Firmicutes bacterium GWF2_51_9]OGS58667.1 MAG: hypothetical protein A2Y19_03820 [Firmicutes bacterium GWE2_51_13]HAM62560.1 ATP synthase F0 subunit A [Erysipelotrichaceae bacterium]HAO62029.1 ATP synthase F0 subunit A [Erysipelotrichaceae bacterium]